MPDASGGLGRGDRVAGAPVVGQGLVVEPQRRPGAAQMPLQVPGQEAHERMRPDPALLAVADGAHPDVELSRVRNQRSTSAIPSQVRTVSSGESRPAGSLVRST